MDKMKSFSNKLSPKWTFPRLAGVACLFLVYVFLTTAVYSQNDDLIFARPDSLGIGPRAMGMGGAFTAVADDASAAYWNVAGLSQLSSYEFSISSAPVYFTENLNGLPAFGFPYYASFQFIMPIAKENTLGISLFRPFHPQIDFLAGSPLSSPIRGEASYLLNPTFQESEIVLSYAARFSAIQNFSVGINVKRVTNDQYYIRYFGNPNNQVASALSDPIQVIGYGVDIGLLFRIPVSKYTEEFRLGVALNNLVSRVQYTNGLNLDDTIYNVPVSFSVGPGYETSVPPEIILGLAYKNNYLFKIRNITDLDFDQISDPRFDDSSLALANKYLRFGTEFWFFRDVLGLRAGYSTPFISPGTISLGLSVRVLNGDFQTDLAYLMPVGPEADISAGSSLQTIDQGGINYEPFHIGLAYRFGGGAELPPPKVSAYVQPPSFTPSQGESAMFYLDTTEDVPVHHWSVLIYDQNNHLVRGLRGQGTPPTKVAWGGEDDLYRPLPAGVYSWAFQVEDQLDHIGSTPVQTVELITPPPPATKDPSKLLAIRQQEASLLAQERAKLTSLAQQTLKDLLGEGASNTQPAAITATPVEGQGNTLYPQAGGVPSLGFPSLTPDQPLNAHFDKNDNGDEIVTVSYKSQQSYIPYLCQEAADVIKTTVNSVGTGLKEISTRVYYGKNELDLVTSTQAAANYASGKISQLQLMQLSDIHINGVKVGPNGY